MGLKLRVPVLLVFVVSYLAASAATAQTQPGAVSESGAELYKQHCAACHGNDLKGGGSVPYPYKVPPNLTTLTRRHGGKFPSAYVADVLRNGVIMPAHGPAQMPIWGEDFRVGDRLNEANVTARITTLTNYVKSRQTR